MLNMAKTKGKKTRENTSIFFAWNSKFFAQFTSLLCFLAGRLQRKKIFENLTKLNTFNTDLWWITALGGIIWEPSTLLTRGSWNNREDFIIFTFSHYFPQSNNIYIMETLCWLTGWKTLITPPFGLKDQIRSFCARGNE